MRPERARTYQTEGIILNRRDWGEADRLITLFTPEYGKLRVVAVSARKPTTRKSGHLELFTRGRFVLARGRTFDKLTQAQTLDYFEGVRRDLARIGQAGMLCELVDRFFEEADAAPAVYDLLHNALLALNSGDPGDLVLLHFQMHLFDLVGYRPALHECVVCGEPVAPVAQFISVELGGVVCPTCRQRLREEEGAAAEQLVRPLSLNALKVLRFLQTAPWPRVRKLRLPDDVREEVRTLLELWATHHLERGLRSGRFLREVEAWYDAKKKP
ncbi:DNA repair protein RecO [Ardenticatena maritima]|uniref:DNA repair protein RecO n=1 Tax=Ardenticatena maritima TaxID=872965 RepID=A0A0M8K5D5_9CHLR|nr:DNA repair protein RecO [Ardenticatena maritima]KPL87785.1 hypothetical protein SE16_09460 [Ardenticatena maritima]GAP62033.1 DNA repair protein RecO [Ardenticatena maritima]